MTRMENGRMKFTCSAPKCPTEVVPGDLFCTHHFAMVPLDVSRRIAYWERERNRSEYLRAVREAKAAIKAHKP